MKKAILILLLLSLALAVFISPFASQSPDGLEKVAEDRKFIDSAGEGENFSAPLPDYTIPGIEKESLSTSLAGLVGTVVTFLIAIGLAFILKKKEKTKEGKEQECQKQ